MNSIMQNYWPIFTEYQAIRSQILGVLSDEDLRFAPGGANRPLGELCVEIGETEHAYIESFKTFKCSFDYRQPEAGMAHSVASLSAWYTDLDERLKAAVEALSEEQIQGQRINRGGNFTLPAQIQLSVYQEALLIFYGKVSVYLKALNRALPQQMAEWIA
jgi:hypothetical protein